MKLRLALLAAAVAVLYSVPTEAAEIAPAPTPKCQPFDVLYYSEARPVVMRLQIMVDGEPLEQAWEGFADALFAKLDTDKSGSLNEKELTKLRPILALLTERFTQPNGDAARAMTREELAAHLQLNGLGPLRLPPIVENNQRFNRGGFRRGNAPTAETLDKAFMDFLDTNKDKKLSPAELAAGATILGKLDTDENELISTDELLGRPVSSPFYFESYDDRMAMNGPRVELQSFGRKPDPSLAKRLLGRYGPKPAATNPNTPYPSGSQPVPVDYNGPGGRPGPVESTARRLAPKDVKLSTEQFAALDQDGDGELDAEELARLGQSAAPEIAIALRLGTVPAGRAPAEVVSGGESLKTAGARGADVALGTPGIRLELIPTGTSAEAARIAFRSRYLDRFRSLDRDKNGYLDPTETNNYFVFRDYFSFLDADGDGKVFEKELAAALDEVKGLTTAAARGLAAVEVAESGRGLFGAIDTDGDGRLSVRELRAMPKLTDRFDADKDGFLMPGEIPRRFQATFAHGLARTLITRQDPFSGEIVAEPLRPSVGPMWFQKMDRNRDGDVSRREFLGTDEEFRKIDTDGDGLLSSQEAEAVGKN